MNIINKIVRWKWKLFTLHSLSCCVHPSLPRWYIAWLPGIFHCKVIFCSYNIHPLSVYLNCVNEKIFHISLMIIIWVTAYPFRVFPLTSSFHFLSVKLITVNGWTEVSWVMTDTSDETKKRFKQSRLIHTYFGLSVVVCRSAAKNTEDSGLEHMYRSADIARLHYLFVESI